jgi:hypothetical protein
MPRIRIRPPRPLSAEQKAAITKADYDQGFGKAPKTARFKKGQSGNPKGKPKGARSLRTDVLAVADLKVQVTTPAGVQTTTIQHAIMLAVAARATKGDVRAAQVFVRMLELTAPDRIGLGADTLRLDPQEEALVNSLLERMELGQPPLPSPPVGDPIDG